jgi:putative NIF3 family GTP cyclohydrolase 1 type 2
MKINRRKFINSSTLATGHIAMFGLPTIELKGQPPKSRSIQEIIDAIIKLVPGGIKSNTVDTIKSGSASHSCRGIATTFMATAPVIQKAIDLNANFIITHEPTFYNHLDETDWLSEDPVYAFKKKLLEDNEVTVWRFHDYWHSINPDGILQGITELLNWQSYQVEPNSVYFNLPKSSLIDLAGNLKQVMGLKRPFIVGNQQMQSSKIALLPGSWGGRYHIESFINSDIDTLVVGEINEWETNEYVRDAVFAGINKGLIIMGHAISEEPGMKYLTKWIRPLVGDIPVHHVPAGDALIAV